MLLSLRPVCQDRQTWFCSVWSLNPWNIVLNPCLHVLGSQGINIFPVKSISFPLNQSVVISAVPGKIEMLVVFIPGQNHMSVWNGCWVPVKDAFQQTRGFPAARGGIVPGRGSGGDRGKAGRREQRDQNGPVAQGPWGLWSGLWLSTHPSWPEAGKRLVSFNSTPMSKHHEAL